MALADLTTCDEVRAVLGVSDDEIEDRTILLVEAPRTSTPDILLDVGRVASEEAGDRRVIVSSLLNQLVQGFACFVHRRRPK